MKNVHFYILIVLLLSSCATVLNNRYEQITFASDVQKTIVLNNDTLFINRERSVTVQRNKQPLDVKFLNDTNHIQIKPSNPFNYLLNAYPTPLFWTGFLIDKNNPKRYNYPRYIYFSSGDSAVGYSKIIPPSQFILQNNNIVKVTPLKLIGLVNPGINLSLERLHNSKFSSQISISALTQPEGNVLSGFVGYQNSFEEKYFVSNFKNKRIYFALETDYLNRAYKTVGNFGPGASFDDSIGMQYLDTIRVKHQQFSVTPKLGIQYYLSQHLVVDMYFGLGLQWRKVVHSERINESDKLVYPRHPNIYDYMIRPMDGLKVSLPLNLRVGWAFR